MFNVLGEPIDDIHTTDFSKVKHMPIHRDAPSYEEQNTSSVCHGTREFSLRSSQTEYPAHRVPEHKVRGLLLR